MTKMITLFGKDLSKLKFGDLKRERRCHKHLLTQMKYMLNSAYAEAEKHPSQIRGDKVAFFEMYVTHLEAIIQEIDYWLDRRYEPLSNYNNSKPKWQIKKENEKRRKRQIRDNALAYDWQKSDDGLLVSWDRDKFFHIASDRGYQTEEAVISEVAKELNYDRTRARLALERGRFTWGQVLCLGAMLQMTPREFCDTFLAGYFTEWYGDYIADYENLNKQELLKRAIKANPLLAYEEQHIEVDSDGKPIDEEVWFDD